MNTAEAIVAGLLAHRLDTLCALPVVQNDHLFDALLRAQERIRVLHDETNFGIGTLAAYCAFEIVIVPSPVFAVPLPKVPR